MQDTGSGIADIQALYESGESAWVTGSANGVLKSTGRFTSHTSWLIMIGFQTKYHEGDGVVDIRAFFFSLW